MSEGTFVCTECDQEKPVSAFYRSPRSAEGHEPRCKVCRNRAAVVATKKFRARNGQKGFGMGAEGHRAKWLAVARGEIPFPEK